MTTVRAAMGLLTAALSFATGLAFAQMKKQEPAANNSKPQD